MPYAEYRAETPSHRPDQPVTVQKHGKIRPLKNASASNFYPIPPADLRSQADATPFSNVSSCSVGSLCLFVNDSRFREQILGNLTFCFPMCWSRALDSYNPNDSCLNKQSRTLRTRAESNVSRGALQGVSVAGCSRDRVGLGVDDQAVLHLSLLKPLGISYAACKSVKTL